MIDRETVMQVGVSGGAVVMFVAIALYASSTYGENGHLDQTGGYVLVGAIAAFIVGIAIAGFWLSRQDFETEDENGEAA